MDAVQAAARQACRAWFTNGAMGQVMSDLADQLARIDQAETTIQVSLPGVFVRVGQRKPVTEKYRRITLMISPQSNDQLRRIADERFLGNMSAATAWSIGLAASVLDGPLKGLQVPANPADALPTATGRRP